MAHQSLYQLSGIKFQLYRHGSL